jgi:hypothetical protein
MAFWSAIAGIEIPRNKPINSKCNFFFTEWQRQVLYDAGNSNRMDCPGTAKAYIIAVQKSIAAVCRWANVVFLCSIE